MARSGRGSTPTPPLREAEAFDPGEELAASRRRGARRGRIARSTAFFSIATAASRVAGLGARSRRRRLLRHQRTDVGLHDRLPGPQPDPGPVRRRRAAAGLRAGLHRPDRKKHYREAFRLASTLLLLITMVLGAITALFVLLAPVIMPLFAPGFEGEILDLTVTLSQVLFPILILLGISGVVVGILNSYDRFGAFAISPLFWNLTIIVVLVVLEPLFHGQNRIYAYAIGILVGTVVQLLIPAWDLRNTPFRFSFTFDWRHPGVRRVLLLMLPVTISLGLINFNQLINSLFGSLVSDQAPAAIDKAFRIYQLPQGIFSVAIATVLFPTLARFANRGEIDNLRATMANGMRQILFVLVPAAAAILALSDPMIRLVYQRGEFDPAQTTLVATALFWFAFSLPTNGLYLLQTRTFFSLQRPWQATGLAVIDLVVSAARRPRPLLAVRGRRHRRRHRHRHDRRGCRPGGDPAPRVRWPGAAAAVLDRREDHDRRRGARRGRLGRLGPARQRARPRPARPDRLARGRPGAWRARLPRRREAAAHRRAGADHAAAAPPLDARPPAATCWVSLELALLVGFAWPGCGAVRGRLLPEFAGAPAHLATGGPGAGPPDLGGRAARQLSAVRAGALSVVVGRRAWWRRDALAPASVAGRGGETTPPGRARRSLRDLTGRDCAGDPDRSGHRVPSPSSHFAAGSRLAAGDRA